MNEGRDVWAGGNLSEKNAAIKKTINRGLLLHKGGELFHKKTPLTEVEILEKGIEEARAIIEKERERRKDTAPFASSPAMEKTETVAAGRISKDEIEKIMKDGGWDKLPLTDRAKEIVEDAISRGAKPATDYTGKLLVEHAIPEEPPAFTRPKQLKVGDTVIPLNWVGVCLQGAKFDLPSVPEAAKIKKMYVGPAKVTKNSYPYGRYPSDLSKEETVTEDRLWGLELDERLGKADDGTTSLPVATRDTTLVLRMDALAQPSGEVNPGSAPRV